MPHTRARTTIEENEPIGIVISQGRLPDTEPAFSAFVWANEPEAATVVTDAG